MAQKLKDQTAVKRFLFCASASGGHLIPALSVARKLKSGCQDCEVLFLTQSNELALNIFKEEEFKVSFIRLDIPRFFSAGPLKSGFKLLLSILESVKTVNSFRPDVVAGFGGVISVTAVLYAKFKGIKTLIHEQNVVLGKANRLLAHFSDTIAYGFKESIAGNSRSRKAFFTGVALADNLRKIDKEQAASYFRLDSLTQTLLVFGGSQGALSFNLNIPPVLAELKKGLKFQIIHIAGRGKDKQVSRLYNDLKVEDVRVYEFIRDMSFAYSLSDLCVCRSGASTVNELAFFRLPAIFIPYPYASSHQEANARVITTRKAAFICKDFDRGGFKGLLSGLLSDKDKLLKMRSSFSFESSPGASEAIAMLLRAE